MILQSMHIGSMIGYTFHNAFSISDREVAREQSMLFKVGKYSNYLCSLSTNLHCMTRRGPEYGTCATLLRNDLDVLHEIAVSV